MRLCFATVSSSLRPFQRPAVRKTCKMSMQGKHVVVTGATRGIGRGIAVAFGEERANVYITGRTEPLLKEVASEINALGGTCHYFVTDHSSDNDVKELFSSLQEILVEKGVGLDILVNNCYAAVSFIIDSAGIPFWKKDVKNPNIPSLTSDPGQVWDLVNGVGLRNHYVCSVHALRLMEPRGTGIIVNITSWGGMISLFDPAYSIGKEAVDRLSAEVSFESSKIGVKSIALCPGYVSTEALMSLAEATKKGESSMPVWNAETPLYVGRVCAQLVGEKGNKLIQQMNGKVVMASEAGNLLNVSDERGFRPTSFRSIRFQVLTHIPYLRTSPLRNLVPNWLVPWPLIQALRGARKYWN